MVCKSLAVTNKVPWGCCFRMKGRKGSLESVPDPFSLGESFIKYLVQTTPTDNKQPHKTRQSLPLKEIVISENLFNCSYSLIGK